MSCRLNHLNKKTGVTYVYESVSYWTRTSNSHEASKSALARLTPSPAR